MRLGARRSIETGRSAHPHPTPSAASSGRVQRAREPWKQGETALPCYSPRVAPQTFDATELRDLLTRVGALAADRGELLELIVLGGAAIALLFESRRTTRDVDVVAALPSKELLTELAVQVAKERGLAPRWLSDEASRFAPRVSKGALIFDANGVRIHSVALEQLLASKLDAMRDDVDRNDAIVVAAKLGLARSSTELAISPYVPQERLVRACEELADIWQEVEDARR